MAVRKLTGTTIVAISRESKAIINPEPSEHLREADTLGVIGNANQIKQFLSTFHLPFP